MEANERLNADEAHEEANMIRAEARVSPDSGKIYSMGEDGVDVFFSQPGREVTPEDYDAALAHIEELKRTIEERPAEFAKKLEDFVNSATQGAGILTRVLGSATAKIPDAEKGGTLLEKLKGRWERARTIEDWNAVFQDAESELHSLQARGARFGKYQKMHDTEEKP